MKNSIKKAILMITVIICTACFMKKSNVLALHPDCYMSNADVYYFADSIPSLQEDDFNTYFNYGNYSIIYDIPYYVDENTLNDMYLNNYFYGFNNSDIVVFEIKTRLISTTLLNSIFEQIQDQGCNIIFVSGFSENMYGNEINTYIDYFVETYPHITFEQFVSFAVSDIILKHNNSDKHVKIIVDYRLVNVNDWRSSKFMQLVLNEFNIQLNLNCTVDDYDDIKNNLYSLNIDFIIGTDPYTFMLLSTTISMPVLDYSELILRFGRDQYNQPLGNGIYEDFNEYYVIGICPLYNNICQIIYRYDRNVSTMPVYLWVIQDFDNDPDGIPIYTDSNLAYMNGIYAQYDEFIIEVLVYILGNELYE